jgi:hypothetical protein
MGAWKDKEPQDLSLNGGSNSIQVVDQPVDEDVAEEGGGQSQPENSAVSEVSLQVNGMMVETAAKVIGRITVLLTKIEELDVTPDEVEQLKNLWAPLVPSISPATAAIIGTLLILGGKIAIYASLKNRATSVEVEEKEPLKKPIKKEEEHEPTAKDTKDTASADV